MCCYVPSCYECMHLINCIPSSMQLLQFVCVNGMISKVLACSPHFSSQFQHRRDPTPASWRESAETEGKGYKLSYEHMGKKEKDPLLKLIELQWFTLPANQLLNLQKQAVIARPGQLERIQLCNSHSASFRLEHHLQSSQLNSSSCPIIDCGGCWCKKHNTS